jgi:Kef-type K+ transport system membrane component KefB/voltage-gated potassium channel Kch
MQDLIRDIALCVAAAWLCGVVAHRLRQPVLLAYLGAGFLLGPSTLGWIHEEASIQTLSQLGLLFLLFMIGLEIDLKKILGAGKSISVTALVQISLGVGLGLLFFRQVGFPLGGGEWDALYLAVAVALSSTVVIVKVLYDQRELDTLTGRITLGIMVLQDLFTILFLALQPDLETLRARVLLGSLARVALLVGSVLLVSRYVLPPLFQRIARLPDLVLIGAMGWCFLVGEWAVRLDLSREMGALVAGVALSTFPYALDVTAKVTSLRDFFVTLFFVSLGMKIQTPDLPTLGWALVIAGFTVTSRMLTVFAPLYLLRHGLRTSLLPGVNLSQISELSLVLMELGASSTFLHVSSGTRDATSLAFVILATASTFAMTRSDGLVRWLVPRLKRAGLRDLDDSSDPCPPPSTPTSSGDRPPAPGREPEHPKIVLLGFFRTASALLQNLETHAPHLLSRIRVVDFNPLVHAELQRRGVSVLYGDLAQRDTLLRAGVADASILVCTVPDSLLKGITTAKLVRSLRELNPGARILTTAEQLHEARDLFHQGADHVTVSRFQEADDLLEAVMAAHKGLLDQKARQAKDRLSRTTEVLP